MIVYKDQGINWHPQSDSLEVSSLKRTCSTPPLVSGLRCLVESLGQIDFALLVVSAMLASTIHMNANKHKWNLVSAVTDHLGHLTDKCGICTK